MVLVCLTITAAACRRRREREPAELPDRNSPRPGWPQRGTARVARHRSGVAGYARRPDAGHSSPVPNDAASAADDQLLRADEQPAAWRLRHGEQPRLVGLQPGDADAVVRRA